MEANAVNLFKCKSHEALFNAIIPHWSPLQASSSPIPRIRNGLFLKQYIEKKNVKKINLKYKMYKNSGVNPFLNIVSSVVTLIKVLAPLSGTCIIY